MLSGLPGRCRAGAWALTLVGFLGCKGGSESSEEPTAIDVSAESEDKNLAERRDALLETRRALALKRADLDEKRRELEAAGGDTTVIEKEVSELVLKEREVQKEAIDLTDELLRRVKDQQSTLSAVAGKISGDARIGIREKSIADRESSLARREKDIAAREAALAAREVKMKDDWQEACAGSGAIISLPSAPAGSKYRKRDVERHLSKANSTMRKRGILRSDLPASLRSLSKAAESSMKGGDYGQAYFAAQQLAKGVASMRVDRGFVKRKFERAKKKVTGDLSDRDAKLLTRITADFGEGRYAAANRRLNELMSR